MNRVNIACLGGKIQGTCNNSVIMSENCDYMLCPCVQPARLSKGFMEELISSCERPEIGLVCARVYDKRKRLSSDILLKGVRDPFGESMKGLKEGCTGYFHRAVLHQEVEAPTDCFLVKGELLKGKDRITLEELCAAIKKQGYRMVYNPWAVVYESR